MEPKEREEVHRSLQFGNKPSQETDKDLGRMTEKTLSGKRLADRGSSPPRLVASAGPVSPGAAATPTPATAPEATEGE
jgi:hypothetical protein